ncbi:hypothetical protein KAT80_00730 [Candidatus Pacearchaeota archaeon]|nr:hypothetical protein [Candidatus Pacearchaeota archaeon]
MENEIGEEDENCWAPGEFVETISSAELEQKKKSIHMGHDEDVNYNCRKCNKKISLHNRDWHAGLCDDCFDKEVYDEKN